MIKKLSLVLTCALIIASFARPGVAANLTEVGNVTAPHGFPIYYGDADALRLTLCTDDSALCIKDTVIPDNEFSVANNFGAEAFWWLAEANAPPLVAGGKALLTLAAEAAFGANEEVKNGNQMAFGRIRIRVDVPVDGTYTVTHPFGQKVFENVTVAEGINYTLDVGDFNFIDPAASFAGLLTSEIGPFLVWPDYQNEPSLLLNGAQYVGDPNVPHVVTGSPSGNNLFKVEGPGGVFTQTNLFTVMGKVYDGTAAVPHTYPPPPEQRLQEVGPVNTETGYPIGYPIFYKDFDNLTLTICPGSDPMCISEPIDQTNENSVALEVGEEAFWWSADAELPALVAGGKARLTLGLEAAFAGDGSVQPGNQISFGRVRVRIDVPVDGTYTVIHPYGELVFENVTVDEGINFTEDIGIVNTADPDSAFAGALNSKIGPFLVWTDYLADPTLKGLNGEQYVGNPAVAHTVTGSPYGTNIFRVIGPEGSNIDVQTDQFVVSGKVFDINNYRVAIDPNAPIAIEDAAATDEGVPVTIIVLANDQNLDATAAVELVPADGLIYGPFEGTVSVAPDNIVTYTPTTPGFTGQDTFYYRVRQGDFVSNMVLVTVDVRPVETLSVTRAEVRVRTSTWSVQGGGTIPGNIVTIYAGPNLDGQLVGASVVGADGRWAFNGRAQFVPGTTSVSIVSTGGAQLLNQPLRVR